jgi:hypothetical protein
VRPAPPHSGEGTSTDWVVGATVPNAPLIRERGKGTSRNCMWGGGTSKNCYGVRNCDVWGSYMWILKGCVKTCNKICQKLGPNLKSLDRPYSQNEYILVRKCLGKENILDCFQRTCVQSDEWCGVWGSCMC